MLFSTLAWSLSFYPQPFLNFRRRSTVGSVIEFPAINILGFLSYLLSTSFLLYSPLIRDQYAARNPVSPKPTVRGNDVAFAAHAAIVTAITLSMFSRGLWGLEQRRGQKISRGVLAVWAGFVVGIVWIIAVVSVKGEDWGTDPSKWAWIDVVSALCCQRDLLHLTVGLGAGIMLMDWIRCTHWDMQNWGLL